MQKDVVVLGLGNPLMTDEGIGGAVVDRLARRAGEFPNVEFIDAGTAGLAILHKLSGRRKAVIVDCCRMGCRPGTMAMFTPEEVRTAGERDFLSLHGADILRLLSLARSLDGCPSELLIFGIEPAVVAVGEGLSSALSERLEDYVSEVLEHLG
jgi:hydrogenase maturation protease